MLKRRNLLIVEPNQQLVAPYLHISDAYHRTRSTSTQQAFSFLLQRMPDLVMLSASFSPMHSTDFLIELQACSRQKLIPLIFVVDLSHHLSHIPGTSWGGSLGILHSLSSEREVKATLWRLERSVL